MSTHDEQDEPEGGQSSAKRPCIASAAAQHEKDQNENGLTPSGPPQSIASGIPGIISSNVSISQQIPEEKVTARKLCEDAQAVKDGTLTSLWGAIDDFLDEKNNDRKHGDNLDFFMRMADSYGHNGCDCGETPEEGIYASEHSVGYAVKSANYFLTWYVVRKLSFEGAERRKAATTMSVFIKYLRKKELIPASIDAGRVKQVLKGIAACGKFNGNALQTKLVTLKAERYWEKKLSSTNIESLKFQDSMCDEMPLEIKEVRKDGWMMRSQYSKMPLALLLLPPEVASMGANGATFSCMEMTKYEGIWVPHGAYGEDMMVCANVYPPSDF